MEEKKTGFTVICNYCGSTEYEIEEEWDFPYDQEPTYWGSRLTCFKCGNYDRD